MKVKLNGKVCEVPISGYAPEAVMHPLAPQPVLPESNWIEVTTMDDGMRSFVSPPEPRCLEAGKIDGRLTT